MNTTHAIVPPRVYTQINQILDNYLHSNSTHLLIPTLKAINQIIPFSHPNCEATAHQVTSSCSIYQRTLMSSNIPLSSPLPQALLLHPYPTTLPTLPFSITSLTTPSIYTRNRNTRARTKKTEEKQSLDKTRNSIKPPKKVDYTRKRLLLFFQILTAYCYYHPVG